MPSVRFATERALHRPASTEAHLLHHYRLCRHCSQRPRRPRGGGFKMTTKTISIVYSARKIELRPSRRSGPEFIKNVRGGVFRYRISSYLVCVDLSPKHPIVFCHGLLGFDSVTIGPAIAPLEVTHWRGIKEVLQANGTEVLMTRVPATSSPIQRAKVLEQKIEETYPGRSVHLLGTSLRSYSSHALTYIQGIVW